MRLFTCLAAWAVIVLSNGVSTKIDFGEESSVATDSSKVGAEDEDVEVKHTIVVSTRLKNNNRRGVHSSGDGEPGTLTYNIGGKSPKNDDSDEVPIVFGTKGVESTRIHTPDTRYKTKIYPDAVFVNRNIRDEYDVYPNVAFNPMQWKPSSFYNNINYRSHDDGIYNRRTNKSNPGKYHRKVAEEKEFYCRKCAELSNGQGYKGCSSVQQRSIPWLKVTTATPQMKIDGKLAKLN